MQSGLSKRSSPTPADAACATSVPNAVTAELGSRSMSKATASGACDEESGCSIGAGPLDRHEPAQGTLGLRARCSPALLREHLPPGVLQGPHRHLAPLVRLPPRGGRPDVRGGAVCDSGSTFEGSSVALDPGSDVSLECRVLCVQPRTSRVNRPEPASAACTTSTPAAIAAVCGAGGFPFRRRADRWLGPARRRRRTREACILPSTSWSGEGSRENAGPLGCRQGQRATNSLCTLELRLGTSAPRGHHHREVDCFWVMLTPRTGPLGASLGLGDPSWAIRDALLLRLSARNVLELASRIPSRMPLHEVK